MVGRIDRETTEARDFAAANQNSLNPLFDDAYAGKLERVSVSAIDASLAEQDKYADFAQSYADKFDRWARELPGGAVDPAAFRTSSVSIRRLVADWNAYVEAYAAEVALGARGFRAVLKVTEPSLRFIRAVRTAIKSHSDATYRAAKKRFDRDVGQITGLDDYNKSLSSTKSHTAFKRVEKDINADADVRDFVKNVSDRYPGTPFKKRV